MNDSDLLQAYANDRDEDAFAEIVRKHLDLVYSAALRQVGGDAHLAQDVTQSVFNDLAHKASSLSSRVVLSGWLYTSARFAASKLVRTEQRRLARERAAHLMHDPSAAELIPDWQQLEAVLDEAMHDLTEPDRNAILLRYFQNCDFQEVAAKIGSTPDAARMRVDRAIEKLRKNLGKRGLASTTAALALILTQQTITAAPAGLAAVVTTSALTSTAATATTLTFLKFMAMTKVQTAAVAVLIAGLTVPIVLQHQTNQQLTQNNEALTAQQSAATAEIEPLKQEIARLNSLIAQPTPRPNSNELFQLRAEVARLREEAKNANRTRAIATATDSADPVHQTLRSLGLRAEQLKKALANHPESQIPELALLREKDYLDAVADIDNLESEEEISRALNNLRLRAKLAAGIDLQIAMKKYAKANNDMIPTDFSQLQPFLEKPIDPAIVERYKIVHSGKLSETPMDQDIIIDIAPQVDPENESTVKFHREAVTSSTYSPAGDAIEKAATAYAEANNGLLPRNPSQLAGLVPANIDPQRIQKFLAKIPPDITTLDQFRKKR